MRELRKYYIGGRWVTAQSGVEHVMVDPSTERPIGTVALGDTHDVDAAVAAAQTALSSWAATDPAERIALIRRMMMHKGRIIESAPTDRFFDTPQSAQAKAFIAGKILIS